MKRLPDGKRTGRERVPQSACEDLQVRFLELLAAPAEDPQGKWIEVWRLFLEHPWYQGELAACARRVARDARARQWLEDVRQDAMLLLARNLQRNPDLRIDPEKARRHFAGWLGTIITNDCREALRRLRSRASRERELQERDLVRDEQALLEERIDLSLAIDRLDEPQRSVVALSRQGHSVKEISELLGLSYSCAYRAMQRGLQALEEALAPGQAEQ